MIRIFRKLISNDIGVAAVENVILIPFLAAVLFVLRDVVFIAYTQIALKHSVNIGAQVGALKQESTANGLIVQINLDTMPAVRHLNLNGLGWANKPLDELGDMKYLLKGVAKMFNWQFRMGLVRTKNLSGVDDGNQLQIWYDNQEHGQILCWLKTNNNTAFEDLMYSLNVEMNNADGVSARLVGTGNPSGLPCGPISFKVPDNTFNAYMGNADLEEWPSAVYPLNIGMTSMVRIGGRRTLRKEDGWLSPVSQSALEWVLGLDEVVITASAERVVEGS